MRLHTLRMHAVGPFADEQVIDFDRLGAGGLFLFEGPTGVGKSTILDALTFALYGGLASDSGDPARLRSDFAGPDDRPEVTLEFSVRGGRHRITRSPEYARPKKRGTGVTKEKASVHLERLGAGGWESRSHAKDEVGTIVGELLGLTREQFRQVVLLPQGEFATFLRAGDDERREVLGKLFGTQFFRTHHRLPPGSCPAGEPCAAGRRRRPRRAGVPPPVRPPASEPTSTPSSAGSRWSSGSRAWRSWTTQLAQRAQAARRGGGSGRRRAGRRRVRCWPTRRSVAARLEQRAQLWRRRWPRPRSSVPTMRPVVSLLARARRAIPVRPLVELVDGAVEQVATLRAAVVAASPGQVADPEHLRARGGRSWPGGPLRPAPPRGSWPTWW